MIKSIKMRELETLSDVNIIDVRERDEYASGHMPKSKNIPLSTFETKLKTLSKDELYYIVCQSGGRSRMAVKHAAALGYNAINVKGGMAAYKGGK